MGIGWKRPEGESRCPLSVVIGKPMSSWSAVGTPGCGRRGGYLQVSTTEAHDRVWVEALEACRELGAIDAIQPLDSEGVAEHCESSAFRGGAFYPNAATV